MDKFFIVGLILYILVFVVLSTSAIEVDCTSQSRLEGALGTTLKIVCILSEVNNQEITVSWILVRNSEPRRISPTVQSRFTEEIRKVSEDVISATLSISKVDIQDEGTYIIDFTSIDVKTSIKIKIQGKPEITNQFNVIYGRPGFNLLLDCRVQSWPYPNTYKWFYQNKLVKYDSKYQVYDRTFRDRTVSHTYLKILNFNHNDTGKYVCIAYNQYGEGELELDARVGKNESIQCSEQYKCTLLQTCNLDHGCICIDGYQETATGSCTDIDECLFERDNCDQVCVNTEASYTCTCHDEYRMNEQTKKCIKYVIPEKPAVNNMTIYAIVGVFVALAVILVIVLIVFIFRKRIKNLSSTPPPQYIFEKNSTPSVSLMNELSMNKVQILHEIGKGRFGKVYLAKFLEAGSWDSVAVKQSRDDLTDEDKYAFLHVLNLAKRIPHNRYIVKFLGYFNTPTLSMMFEYMPLGDLLSFLRMRRPSTFKNSNASINENPLTAANLFNFALQCAKGMQHLHENKIIHRDLAARNILVSSTDCCKISDFGMARKVGEDYRYTSKSKRPLPILWMAPEAIFDDLTSNKSDVWSYGVLFWEIITFGSRPYPGKSGPQALQMIQNGDVMDQPQHCTMEIYRVLQSCWKFEAEERPEFHEIVDEMEMRVDLAEEYIMLENYDKTNYYFVDNVSMSDLDLDNNSEDDLRFFSRSRSSRSLNNTRIVL